MSTEIGARNFGDVARYNMLKVSDLLLVSPLSSFFEEFLGTIYKCCLLILLVSVYKYDKMKMKYLRKPFIPCCDRL